MLYGNAIVGQSGGPTAAINATLAGVIRGLFECELSPERACEQLITRDTSITDIGLNCGFNEISYFIKTFRRHVGTTPHQYRKKMRSAD